jgi:hypothetical protein
MRRPLFILLLLLTGCDATPEPQEQFPDLPKVRTIQPRNVPNERASLHIQAETIYLRLDADAGESWSYVTTQGLDAERVRLWRLNGLRVGTMNSVEVSQFYAKLPRTGGSKVLTIGVGREPIVIETTPRLERAIDIAAMLGFDRDETVRLPAGKTQMLIDAAVTKDAVIASLKPHHHWVEHSISPRTPQEKAMDGRVFRELELDADLTGDRFLVIAWEPREPVKAKPVAASRAVPDPAASPPVAPPDPAVPSDPRLVPPAAPQPAPAPPREPTPPPAPPQLPRLGDIMFTGTRSEQAFQLICIMRIPPQRATQPDGETRPD